MVTVTEGVNQNIDVGKHEAFRKALEADPDKFVLGFRATGTAEDTANRTTAVIGEWSLGDVEMDRPSAHVLKFGLPAEVEDAVGVRGAVDRMEAVEGALAALTACVNGTIGYNAVREGLTFDKLTTRVSIPLDTRVLFGVHGEDRAGEMLGDLEIDVDVEGDDVTDEVLERMRGFTHRSPVYNLLTRAHPSEARVKRAA